jgi:hypothetical protein
MRLSGSRPVEPDTGCQAAAPETATKWPPSYVGVCPRTAHVDTSIQAGRPIHEVRPRPRPRNIANSYKEAVHRCLSLLSRSLIFFCVEDQPYSFLFSPPILFKVASLPAPPKPSLDQERLQLIALSCIRHPGHTRGAYSLCSHQGNFAAHRRSVQDRSSASFVLPRWTPVEYNRYSCWSGGCIYTKKDITLCIGWILSGIFTISASTWKRLGRTPGQQRLGILIEVRNFKVLRRLLLVCTISQHSYGSPLFQSPKQGSARRIRDAASR